MCPYQCGANTQNWATRSPPSCRPENIEFLYELVEIGEKVRIINEPFLIGTLNGDIYFEGHAPLEDDELGADERLDTLFTRYSETNGSSLPASDRDHVRSIASAANGVPARIAPHDADEVLARARLVENIVVENPDAPTLSEVREMIDEANREAETAEALETEAM